MDNDKNVNPPAGRTMKPVLMSALLFPGAGQYVLGRKLLSLVFALPALAAAAFFLWTAIEPAYLIADEINRGVMAFDILKIRARLHQHHGANPNVTLAIWVIVLAWAGSIADAWLRPAPGRTDRLAR